MAKQRVSVAGKSSVLSGDAADKKKKAYEEKYPGYSDSGENARQKKINQSRSDLNKSVAKIGSQNAQLAHSSEAYEFAQSMASTAKDEYTVNPSKENKEAYNRTLSVLKGAESRQDKISSDTRKAEQEAQKAGEKYGRAVEAYNKYLRDRSRAASAIARMQTPVYTSRELTAQKERNDMLSLDVEKAQQDAAALRKESETDVQTYYDLNNQRSSYLTGTIGGQSDPYVADIERRMQEILDKYGASDIDDVENQLSQRDAYIKRAAYLQEGARMGTVGRVGAQNYDPLYSAYSSQRRTIPTKEQIRTSDINSDQSRWTTGADGKLYDASGNLADPNAKPLDVSDKLGIFLSASDADIADATGAYLNSGSTWDKIVAEGSQRNWDQMTDQEISNYYYYLNKQGEEAAGRYLDSIQEALNQRAGAAKAAELQGKTGRELLFGISAGLDQFNSGMQGFRDDLFGRTDYRPATDTQYASAQVRQDLADDGRIGNTGVSLGQVGYDLVTNVTNMAPSILASTVLSALNPAVGSAVGSGIVSASAAGNAYTEAANKGYTQNQARTYSALVGASEAGLQYILGGIKQLGGGIIGKGVTNALNKADNALARFALQFGDTKVGQVLANAVEEGTEEYIQELLEPWFENVVAGADNEIDLASDDAIYAGLLGALTGGLFELASRKDAPKYNPEKKTEAPKTDAQRAADVLGNLFEDAKRVQDGTFGESSVDVSENGVYDNQNSIGGVNNESGLRQYDGAGSPGDSAQGMAGVRRDNGNELKGRGEYGGLAVDSGLLRVSEPLQKARQNRGVNSYDLFDTTSDAVSFSQALTDGRNSDPQNGWCVTPKSVQELRDGNVRTFMNESGTVGFGVAPDGDIVAVFKNKNGGPSKALDTAMPAAIEMGGDRLDCYGDGLVKVYSQYGFEPVARVEFSREFANDGWSPEKGTPYIYVMMHNGDDAATVTEKMGTYHKYTKAERDALPTFGKEDYDSAMAYRDNLISQRNAQNTQSTAEANPSVGAADKGFTGVAEKYYDLLSDKTAQPDRPGDVRPMEVPTKDPYGRKVSEFVANAYGAAVTSDRFVDTIQELVVDGALGHDVKTQAETLQDAVNYIKNAKSLSRVEAELTAAAMDGKATDTQMAMAMILFADYNQSKSEAQQRKAAEMMIDLQTMATDSARKLNLVKVFRSLTPQGRAETVKIRVQRYVDSLNKRRSSRNQLQFVADESSRSSASSAILEAKTDIRNALETVGDSVSYEDGKAVVKSNQSGEPFVFEYAQKVADSIAQTLAPKAAKEKTFLQQIASQIKRFANEKVQKANVKSKPTTAVDLLRDYVQNQSFYNDVWENLQSSLRDIDPEGAYSADIQSGGIGVDNSDARNKIFIKALVSAASDAGEMKKVMLTQSAFGVTGISENIANDLISKTGATGEMAQTIRDAAADYVTLVLQENETSQKSDSIITSQIRSCMKEIGTTITQAAASSQKTKKQVEAAITDILTKRLGIGSADASRVADVVSVEFEQMLKNRSAEILKSKFAEKKPQQRTQKSTEELIQEYAALGAFDVNSAYNEKATAKIFGTDGTVSIPQELIDNYIKSIENSQSSGISDSADASGKKADPKVDPVANAENAIYNYVASQIGSTFAEKWNAWRHLCMLGNLSTQIRNFGGNIAFRPYVTVKRVLGAAMEKAFRVPQEERTKAVLGLGKDANLFRRLAIEDANSQIATDLMTGSAKTGNDARSKIDEARVIFDYRAENDSSSVPKAVKDAREIVNKGLNTASKGVTNAMEGADMIFKRWEYSTSLATFLKAQGYTAEQWQNGQLPAEVLSKARAYAAQEAMKATFNDRNSVSDAVSKLRYKGDNPFLRTLDIAGEGVFPYRRTPANVAVRIFEYSPANIARGVVNALTKVRTGKMEAATCIDQLASGLTGTGAMVLGGALASGLFGAKLKGSDVDDDEKRAGHQTYSLEFGDKSVTIDWVAPAVVPLFVGANLYDRFFGDDGGSNASAFSKFVSSQVTALEPMLELSCLSSFSDLLETARRSKEGEAIYTIAAQIATSYMLQGLPTLGAKFDQLGSKNRQMVYSSAEDTFDRSVQKFVGKLTQKIPGDAYQTDYVDAWGRTDKTNWFESLVSPSYVNKIDHNPADDEIARLNKVQDENVSPSTPSYDITIDGNKRRLTAEEWTALAKEQGQMSYDIVTKLVQSSEYKNLPDAEKAKAIQNAYKYAREYARVNVLSDYAEFDSSWMEDIDGNAEEVILQRATVDASGLGSEARYSLAIEKGITMPEMQKVSSAVNERLKGIDQKTDYDRYRAVVQSVPAKDASKWLEVYGMSESRLDEMQNAAKSGVSSEQYIDYLQADSAMDSAMKEITSAWKNGELPSTDDLKQSYDSFKKLPANVQSYFRKNDSGRTAAFIDASDAGVKAETFVDLWKSYYELSSSDKKASEKAVSWAQTLDNARISGKITQKQRDILFDDLGFYSQVRQDAARYTELTSDAGLAPSVAVYVQNVMKDLTKAKDKYSAISSSTLKSNEKIAAARVYMTDEQEEKMDSAFDIFGENFDLYASLYGIYSDASGKGKKARTINSFMQAYGLSRSQAERIYKVFAGQ